MMKKIIVILACMLILSMLSGCWNRKEFNDISLAVGMAIDKVKNGYRVSVQVVNPGEIAQQSGKGGVHSPVTVYSATGKSLFEGIRKIIKASARKTYFSHLRVLIIDEDLAKDGVAKTLDMIWRDQEFRTDFFIVISKESSAEEILNVLTPIDKIPANHVYKTLEASEKAWAPTSSVTINEFIQDLLVEGKNPVAGGIEVDGNTKKGGDLSNINKINPDARLVASHIALFKKDKLVGWLMGQDESKGYNYIMGNVKSTVGYVTCPDGRDITLEIIRTKAKITGDVKNGKPHIHVNVQVIQNVADVECNIDVSNQKILRKLEAENSRKITKMMEKTVAKAKEKNTDIFGFGAVIHRSNPQEWKRIKNNWDEEFKKLDVKITAKTIIKEFGTIGQPLLKEQKE